jgi:hypothetical protein
LWPKAFIAPNTVEAFDEDSVAHTHRSIFYYSATAGTSGGERHDHVGYCYGWGNDNCTILIIGNVYIVKPDLCCVALPNNSAVPRDWLTVTTWIGKEVVNGINVDHWYGFEHEYWSMSDAPFNGVRYTGPNFKTPRQFTTYDPWLITDLPDSLFDLPQGTDCSQPCP